MSNIVAQSTPFVDLSRPPPPLFVDFTKPPPMSTDERVEAFLSERNLQHTPLTSGRCRHRSKVSLGAVKSDFLTSQALLKDLKAIEQEIQHCPDGVDCDSRIVAAENIKIRLQEIELKYSDPQNVDDLQKLYDRRQKKRQRNRRRNAELRGRKAEAARVRQEKHAHIDQWQSGIAAQLRKEQAAEAEAAHAKTVLADVTRKIGDAKKYLAEFQALIELRKARKVAVQASDLGEKDFEAKIYELEQVWLDALANYRQEEATLREILAKRSVNAGKLVEKRWHQVLFGDQVASLHNHPLLRAEKDFDEFVAIRRAWDTCLLADDNDASGSHIPSGWVMPNADPLPAWKVYRQDNKLLD